MTHRQQISKVHNMATTQHTTSHHITSQREQTTTNMKHSKTKQNTTTPHKIPQHNTAYLADIAENHITTPKSHSRGREQ